LQRSSELRVPGLAAVRVGPFPSHQAAVPRQDGARRDQPVCPQRSGQLPDQRGQHRPVGVAGVLVLRSTIIRWRWFQIRVRSSSSRRQLPIRRSVIEFMRGAATAERMTRVPAAWNTASDACVKLVSRSCRTNFARVPASSRSMSRFRGLLDDPGPDRVLRGAQTRTRRLPCPVTARTYAFVPLSRSAVKKSSARTPCACDRRNSARPAHRGSAGIPNDSFTRASRSTTDRTVRRTGGRPERPRRDNRAQRRRTMSRCHRKIVAGVTISRIAAS
jgi:hypothetical protein